jgi:hypothetical protein
MSGLKICQLEPHDSNEFNIPLNISDLLMVLPVTMQTEQIYLFPGPKDTP